MVLAIEVAEARGSGLAFVPGLAFAVILVTNALLVLASFRVRRSEAADSQVHGRSRPLRPRPRLTAHPRRRWMLNAVMLFLLAVGGLVLWYGNHPEQLQPQGVVQWIKCICTVGINVGARAYINPN